MNSAQATELFKAFGKVRVAPQSCGKADVSLGRQSVQLIVDHENGVNCSFLPQQYVYFIQ